MAQFGAKRPRFAPTTATPENALPTYDATKIVTVGKLVAANLTVNNASGELYGDDGLAEKVDMFASGSLELNTDDKTDEVHAAIHGASKDTESSEVTDADGDTAPRGGLTYYKVLIRNGVRIYKGVFHPLVSAILGNDSAATKGSSITFGTSTTTFNVFRCNSGAWRITKEFTGANAEADCIAWCDTKLNAVAKVAAPVAYPAAGAVASGTEVALMCATAGATIYYTLDGTTPTTESTAYTGAIEITAAKTIKAIAVKSGMNDSDVTTAAYTISA
ncbi:MAG: chitobiase/beta-hexosaminidase C-terminal domain-containing protein [Oscillospiraceae bacterium]|nr:chitobiase/beta-hexosaminidase C-terminal domain-containing protein [Oscillospiraceae bacterium]